MIEDDFHRHAERMIGNPKYQALVMRRTRFCAVLMAIVSSAYFGYIVLVAFDKPLLATPIAGGTTSWGIPIGFGVIVLTIVCTALYAIRANSEFDALTQAVIDEAKP